MNPVFINPVEKSLGLFSVRRLLPSDKQRMIGPWIFFDHFGPTQLPSGEGMDVRPHPHINLATVTYLFDGEIIHRDSLGCVQAIRPGELNLMVAGRGIVHSERESHQVRQASRTLHGVQLWCALPESDEECDPAFYHYSATEIPEIDIDGVAVNVLIGSGYGVASPVVSFSETFYATAFLKKGQTLLTPDLAECGVYVIDGQIQLAQAVVSQHRMMVLSEGGQEEIKALEDSHVVMIGGDPLGQRLIDWNFVSSNKDRIARAKARWREQSFPPVPGDEKEYIPLPER